MTVFVNGEPLAQQCDYTFPTDREWLPSIGFVTCDAGPITIFSAAV